MGKGLFFLTTLCFIFMGWVQAFSSAASSRQALGEEGVAGKFVLNELTLSLDDKYPAPRWEYEGEKVSPLHLPLKNLKVFWRRGEFRKCLQQVSLAVAKIPALTPWIKVYELRCAEGLLRSMQTKKDKGAEGVRSVKRVRGHLNSTLGDISQQSPWLMSGPYRENLREAWISGWIFQLEHGASFLKCLLP